MSPKEARELMRVDEEMRASQRECTQLRASLATARDTAEALAQANTEVSRRLDAALRESATVTADRDALKSDEKLYIANVERLESDCERWLKESQDEREAHAETRKALDICSVVHNHNVKLKADLESTRAALAQSEARVAAALACAKGTGEAWTAIGPRMLKALRG